MMKAIVYKKESPYDLRIDEVEKPISTIDEVLVKVHAAGINRADILQKQGKYPPPKGASPILGLEIAGEVVTDHSQQWQAGSRVFGLVPGGGYSQYATIHKDMLMPIPYQFTYQQVAAIPEAFLTAYQSIVWQANVQPQETILIHAGASGVGSAAIQISRQIGAKIIVTASAQKHQHCYELGADYCIDYQSEDFEEIIKEKMKKEGVDVILDLVGAKYYQQNLNSLALDGRMVMLAFQGGSKVPQVSLVPIIGKRLSIYGSTLRNRSMEYQIKLTKSFLKFAEKLYKNKNFKPAIDKVFPWHDVNEAHKYMEENKNKGKLVLNIQ